MIAGGTGITPLYPIIRAALQDPDDTTEISLLFANRREQDIILKQELDSMAIRSNGRLRVYYVLSELDATSTPTWSGGIGRITSNMIEEHLSPRADDVRVLMCGM